jgi:hypothetical protein
MAEKLGGNLRILHLINSPGNDCALQNQWILQIPNPLCINPLNSEPKD